MPLHESLEEVEYDLDDLHCALANIDNVLQAQLCKLEDSYVVI